MFDNLINKIKDKASSLMKKEDPQSKWIECPKCGQKNRTDFDKCVFCDAPLKVEVKK